MWDQYIERQRYTNTEEYFIEKFGPEDGPKMYEECNYQKGSSVRYEDLLAKGLSHEEIVKRIAPSIDFCCSKGERKFIDKTEEMMGFEFKYSYKTKQFCIYDSVMKRPYFYDAVDTTLNIILEYNGNIWHGDPNRFNATDIVPMVCKPAQDVWDYDKRKIQVAEERGFSVKVI